MLLMSVFAWCEVIRNKTVQDVASRKVKRKHGQKLREEIRKLATDEWRRGDGECCARNFSGFVGDRIRIFRHMQISFFY
jgi:hypothetical protein